jgi:2-hydroxy-3-oxopropionate reductase
MKVGIVGTGLMGYPMAINIAKKFDLKSFNRTFEKMKGLDEHKIILCKSIKELCSDTDVIICMLPGDQEVLEIVNQLKRNVEAGAVIVDMSSTKVSTANQCYKILKEVNANFIDSPVSGGPEGARSGTLAIMAGGDERVYLNVKELLETMGNSTLVGPNGSGQVAKLCNQIIVGVTIGAVAEAVILCEKNGADPKKFIKAVKGGFADGKILQNHGQRMIDKDFLARGKNITHLKDMNNIIECADEKGVKLPLSQLVQNMFNNLCNTGFENDDHCSLYKEILNKK